MSSDGKVPAEELVSGDLVMVNIAKTPMHESEFVFAFVSSTRHIISTNVVELVLAKDGLALGRYVLSHDHMVTVVRPEGRVAALPGCQAEASSS